jgi:metal-responsive CopG/Arc/MetJ family transcriptional regulator
MTLDRKVPVGISLPESVIALVDETRGEVPRSQFILRILRDAIQKRGARKT